MLPIQCLYNPEIVSTIKLFFRPERHRTVTTIEEELQFDFAEATREKYEQLKQQAKSQLVNKWRELTEGGGARTFGSIFGSSKHLTLSLKLIAPHIIIPTNTCQLHIGLGYWQMGNRVEDEDGESVASSAFATPPENEDEFEDAVEEILINPVETEQHQKQVAFDIYTLNIQNFQITIGDNNQDWIEILNRGYSSYHLLNSVNFSLQIKRQLILSYDDEAWLDMHVTLSEFTINMSALQAQMLNHCIKSLDTVENLKRRQTAQQLRDQGTLTQAKQAYSELEERERKKLDKIKEQRQVLIGFSVDKIVVNLTDDNFAPLCAMQLEEFNWQFVKKPLSGQSSFDIGSFVLVDHKASKLGEEYHFIISCSRRCGIDVGSGIVIDSGGPMTPINYRAQKPESFSPETPKGLIQSAVEKLYELTKPEVKRVPTMTDLDSHQTPLIQTTIVWYHSSSPDLHDKPVGVSYQTIECKFSSIDIVVQPSSWAHTVSIVDKIAKQFEFIKRDDHMKTDSDLESNKSPVSLSKPWHRTFTLEFETIHTLFTRILKRGQFEGHPQKIMSMKVKNTNGTLVIDENQGLNLDARITGIIAHDLTHANPNAKQRTENSEVPYFSRHSPVRLFSVGNTDRFVPDIGEAFQYIYCNEEESSDGGNALSIHLKNTADLTMNIGGIKYVHSARFLSEFLDSIDQFEREWGEKISREGREYMKTGMSKSMRKVMTTVGMEAAFYNPDEVVGVQGIGVG